MGSGTGKDEAARAVTCIRLPESAHKAFEAGLPITLVKFALSWGLREAREAQGGEKKWQSTPNRLSAATLHYKA